MLGGSSSNGGKRRNTHRKSRHHQPNHHSSSTTSDDPSTATTVFSNLQQRVTEAFTQELARATVKGRKLASMLSVKDLKFNEAMTSCQPELQLLDILEGWNTLLAALQQENVFTDYVDSLNRAFSSLYQYDLNRGNNILRHVHVLLDLLTQAVNAHDRDKSIECRFVTLLEVVLSYNGPSWYPSAAVSAMWVRLMQRIPSNISPESFRRKAYRVLVSLSWVTSSKGLLEACSFDVSKQTLDFSKDSIRDHMARIRGGPLPRYDCVNQLLDRLKDETDVCVAITSEKEGLGKTTLAGQVASHPSILRVFTVLWLVVKEQDFTYDVYLKYLTDLCQQMGCPDQTWPMSVKRFEEAALRRLRGRDCLKAAKAQMSELVASHGRNILLVLDDVKDAELIEWFRFDDRQSIIITTPNPNLSGIDWALELVPLSQDEAVELFVKEAGLPSNHMLGATIELRSIIRHCDYNPLLIRTIARWYQLKQVSAPMATAIEEILADLTSLSSSQAQQVYEAEVLDQDPNMLLFDILCLMMGPARVKEHDHAPSTLFVLCFSAQVVVFPDGAPLDVVLLLWEQVLKTEVIAIEELGGSFNKDELRRHTWLMAEGLTHMGVIEVVEVEGKPWVKVHHALYKDFAILMAREMDLKETFQDTVADWHMAFVKGYIARKSRLGDSEQQDAAWKYAIEKLPSHMFDGKMLPTVELVLGEEAFFRARIAALGWRRGLETQIEDCVSYQQEIEAANETNGILESPVSSVFQILATLVREKRVGIAEVSLKEQVFEEARSLYLIGFALAENGYYEEALEHFQNAELLSSSTELQSSVLYAMGWCYISANQAKLARKKINACRKIMSEGLQTHSLYKEMLQLYADALVAGCDYRAGASFLRQLIGELKATAASNAIELGTALYKYGRLLYLMREYDLALDALDKCVNWKVEIEEVSMSLSSALGLLGDISFELGMLDESKDRYVAALQTLEALQCDANHLDYRLLTGKLQFLENDLPSCKQSLELVRRTINATPVKSAHQSAYDLRYIALVYEELYDTHESITVLNESLALTNDCQFSLERAATLLGMGNCLVKIGNNGDALECYEKALEIQIIKLGESAEVIDTTNLTGSVLVRLGEVDAAIQKFQRNYETTTRIAPNDVERIAGVLYLLGDAYKVNGSFDKSVSCFEKCLEILEQDRTADHPDIAKTLQRLGDVHISRNDHENGCVYYARALAIRSKYDDEELVAETNHSLGIAERLQGHFESAQVFLTDALRAREKIGITVDRVETMIELGKVCMLQSQPELALRHYSESLSLVQSDSPQFLTVLMAIGHAKLAEGDYNDALSHYERAASNDSEAGTMRTGSVLFCLGLTCFLMDDATDATRHFNEFLLQGHSDPNHLVALTHLLLGDIFDASRNYTQATASWTCCRDVCDDLEKKQGMVSPHWIGPMLERRLAGDGSGMGYLSLLHRRSYESIRCQEEVTLRSIPHVDEKNQAWVCELQRGRQRF